MSEKRSVTRSESAPSPTRRAAIGWLVGGWAALAAGWTGLVLGFLANAFRRSPERSWHPIGPAAELPATGFRRIELRMPEADAWRTTTRARVIYVRGEPSGAGPLALLSTCTHLGCSVEWDDRDAKFRCPCHGGTYDADGRVLAGPPPRPLTRLEVRVEGDRCFVRLPTPWPGPWV